MSEKLEQAKERLKEANLKVDTGQKVMTLSQAIMLIIQEIEYPPIELTKEDNEWMDSSLGEAQPEAQAAGEWQTRPWFGTYMKPGMFMHVERLGDSSAFGYVTEPMLAYLTQSRPECELKHEPHDWLQLSERFGIPARHFNLARCKKCGVYDFYDGEHPYYLVLLPQPKVGQ